jgi:DNA-binding transcriptional regulator LsrR (DeoR family)
MIDLYYVAGVSIREIATLLSVSPFAVIRELRFAKSWLCIKLPAEG